MRDVINVKSKVRALKFPVLYNMPAEQLAEVDRQREKLGYNRTAFVNQAIEFYLKALEEKNKE